MEEITYDDFAKLEIRIGTIIAAELVPETDKLIKCTVDFGDIGTRTIVSGIALWKKPEDIVGRQCPYIINLAPRVIRGVESQGMLIAPSHEEQFALLHPDVEMPAGSRVK